MKKGKVLEQVEKAIQEHLNGPDTVVVSNAKLKDVLGIEREIDVFVYATNDKEKKGIAFECRDHKRKVGLFEIDSFIGKYQDLPQITKVIVVSTSGFTKDAQCKAENYNIGLHTIEDVSYEEILRFLNVFRVGCKIELLPQCFMVIDGTDTLLPQGVVKVYNEKTDAEVNVLKSLSTFLQMQISSIHDKLCADNTNTKTFPFTFMPPEPWYIFDINNTKRSVREFHIETNWTMIAHPLDISTQKLDVTSSVRVSEWSQTDVDDLVSVHDGHTYSVFIKDNDDNIRRASVVPQYSSEN